MRGKVRRFPRLCSIYIIIILTSAIHKKYGVTRRPYNHVFYVIDALLIVNCRTGIRAKVPVPKGSTRLLGLARYPYTGVLHMQLTSIVMCFLCQNKGPCSYWPVFAVVAGVGTMD